MEARYGDADIAAVASLIADGARARMLLALTDGRALPASLLADEAGVARSTASEHLRKLVDAGLVSVYPQGRRRYFRLKGAEVGALIEALARLAPAREVRTLKEGNRAHALRDARTCYDHLAGRLGVRVFTALIDDGSVVGGDGVHRLDTDGEDRLSAPGRDVDYHLTNEGVARLERLGVALPRAGGHGPVAVRYCVDWTEQRHHAAGGVGRALLARLLELGWLERDASTRAVRVVGDGRRNLRRVFGAAVLD